MKRLLALLAVVSFGALQLSGPASALATSHASSFVLDTASVWGGAIGDSPAQVSGLPPGTLEVQAANWGGLAIGPSQNVYTWSAGKDPSASIIDGPTDVASIGEGGGSPFGAAVTQSGTLWTWGYDESGELCNGETGRSFAPQAIDSVQGAAAVSGGQQHLLILTGSGTVEACGNNADGQ
jgi:hypothetical protein